MQWRKPDHRQLGQQAIKWLLDGKTGPSWSGDVAVQLVLRELGELPAEDLNEAEVAEILDLMYAQHLTTVLDFESLFDQHLKPKRAANRPAQQNWSFYLPAPLKLQAGLPARPRIRCGGHTFVYTPTAVAQRVIGQTTLVELQRQEMRSRPPGARWREPEGYFVVVMQSRTMPGAWSDVAAGYDALRGALELSASRGVQMLIRPHNEPRSKVPLPPWLIIVPSAGPARFAHFLSDRDELPARPLVVKADRYRQFRRMLRPIAQRPTSGSTAALFQDALRLYAQAMDAAFVYETFFGFWQLLERLTLSDSGSTEKVVARTTWHAKRSLLPGSGIEYIMTRFARYRNNIVHHGAYEDITDQHVNEIKTISEIVLYWTYHELKRYPTQDLLRRHYRKVT